MGDLEWGFFDEFYYGFANRGEELGPHISSTNGSNPTLEALSMSRSTTSITVRAITKKARSGGQPVFEV